MIISSPSDYRLAAKSKLPAFLFHYLDGGAFAEETLQRNTQDLKNLTVNQRVLKDMSALDMQCSLFGEALSMPIALAPIGINGMYARRGEVQSAKAAQNAGIPYTLSTVSVCSMEEVSQSISRPLWLQIYPLQEPGFLDNMLERAKACGVQTLVFTVDMPTPGARYRDVRHGMMGPYAAIRRISQACMHPSWALDVGVFGRPHELGNVSVFRSQPVDLEDAIGWNFDASFDWEDLAKIREKWDGNLVVKGIMEVNDAKNAVHYGADALIVSNHGGRQLDGVPSTASALPKIADAVKGEIKILADSGIRSGLDVLRMLALGADCTLIGRSFVYALAANGQAGVEHLLSQFKEELRIAMTLTGCNRLADIDEKVLAECLKLSSSR